MAMENRLLRRDPLLHGRIGARTGERKSGRKLLHSSYIIDSEPLTSDFPSEIQLCDPKKARTRTRTVRLGKWCRDVTGVFRSGRRIGRKSASPRVAYNNVQCEFINSRTLVRKRELILWLDKKKRVLYFLFKDL